MKISKDLKIRINGLGGIAKMKLEYMEKHQPKLLKVLLENDQLFDHIKQASGPASEYLSKAMDIDPQNYHPAMEIIRETWINLPDCDNLRSPHNPKR